MPPTILLVFDFSNPIASTLAFELPITLRVLVSLERPSKSLSLSFRVLPPVPKLIISMSWIRPLSILVRFKIRLLPSSF